METTVPNLSPSDFSAEQTITISESSGNSDQGADSGIDAISKLPVKPQERYKFIRSIGFGGMKGVLLVHDRDTDRDVAMAIMPDFRDRPRQDLNRFVREAYITAKLEHPNIVPIHDIGVDQSGSPYFTMKYLHGQTLAMILHNRQLGKNSAEFPQERLLQILIRICNAIAFAHRQGISHLDLKPGNIYCGDFGEVQVIDWGLAAAVDDDFDKGILQGTPGYMSPEFIRSEGKERPGPAADIYAIGAILYAILANSTPFPGMSQQEILRRTLSGRIKPPSYMNPAVDPGLEAVCMKALSTDPRDRYKSVLELRREIIACIDGFPTQAENPSNLRRLALYTKRHGAKLTIAVLLLLLIIVSSMLLIHRMGHPIL